MKHARGQLQEGLEVALPHAAAVDAHEAAQQDLWRYAGLRPKLDALLFYRQGNGIEHDRPPLSGVQRDCLRFGSQLQVRHLLGVQQLRHAPQADRSSHHANDIPVHLDEVLPKLGVHLEHDDEVASPHRLIIEKVTLEQAETSVQHHEDVEQVGQPFGDPLCVGQQVPRSLVDSDERGSFSLKVPLQVGQVLQPDRMHLLGVPDETGQCVHPMLLECLSLLQRLGAALLPPPDQD
mmetsp:Transcript_82271/g.254342  ORF Transcript_82271/g.254342 Transcript_82271/m.254342 type:complete len:235 (+) Transcript_82271:532-1236(+)